MTIYEKVLSQIGEARREAERLGRHIAFCIASTAKLNNPDVFFPPIRYTPHMVVANVIVRSVDHLPQILAACDRRVDYLLVDADQRFIGEGALLSYICSSGTSTPILSIKVNDFTVDAADAMLAQWIPELDNATVAILGAGNAGGKLALKLVERGAHVSIWRRDRGASAAIAVGIEALKPRTCRGSAVACADPVRAASGATLVVGFTPGVPVITDQVIHAMQPGGYVLDGGIGTVCAGAFKVADERGISIRRLDMRAGFAGQVTSVIETHRFIESVVGQREIDGVTIVAGGIVGPRGSAVVDSVEAPRQLIGVADGLGGLLPVVEWSAAMRATIERVAVRLGIQTGRC